MNNYDIEVSCTYKQEDSVFFSPDKIEELYKELLDSEPSIDKDAAISEIICEIAQELIDEVMDMPGCYDRDGIEIDTWPIECAVEDYVTEHWDETEHPLEDSEGQLHLFDPNEYNE